MRKIIVSEFVTLDGVYEDPGGADGTKHGGWSLKHSNDEYGKYKYDELFAGDALLLGRKTYEGFAAAWPKMEGTGDFGERMNSLPKYVVSSTLKDLSWNNAHLVEGDLVTEIGKLKQQDGQDILVFGSGQLVNFLLDNNLVDELRLMVHPVIAGEGKRLFEAAQFREVQLASVVRFGTGTIVLVYKLSKEAL